MKKSLLISCALLLVLQVAYGQTAKSAERSQATKYRYHPCG